MTDVVVARLAAALSDRYRIERELGAGGMATVYLAHDLRHDRDVAIKTLHPDLAAALGGERFLSEIRTTARLQHPHILPLLDSGSADGLLYYVMPYVAGETLRSRLDRERQLPLDDALLIAREVADALQSAHQLGIIHRDIKPENILLQGGHALVADFGIALAVQSAGGARMTQTGLSLGTPQYMSPEQAMGERTIDARSDQYALAAVTYEMLAGEPPFTGPTVQAIIAKALSERPVPISTLRDTVPVAVEQTVLRALAKLPADRFTSVQEFAAGLRTEGGTASSTAATNGPTAAARRDTATRAAHKWRLSAIALGVLSMIATGFALRAALSEHAASAGAIVIRAKLDLPPEVRIATNLTGNTIVVSPDGRMIAYTTNAVNGLRLYIRHFDELTARELGGGNVSGRNLTFSPDGKWLAFTEGNVLRKIAVDGGTPVTLGSTGGTVPYGMSWSASDTLRIGSFSGLYQVSANGGTPTLVPRADSATARLGLRWPIVLPDERSLLVVRGNTSSAPGQLSRFDLQTGRVTHYNLQVSTPAGVVGGQLVYVSVEGALHAVPIDVATGEPAGEPRLLINGLFIDPTAGAKISLSASGTLAYLEGRSQVQPVLVTPRTGTVEPLMDELRAYTAPRYSPDGRRVAFGVSARTSTDIWIYDVKRRTLARLTTDGVNVRPEWSPDGKELIFIAEREGEFGIWRQAADGGSPATLLYKPAVEPFEALISPDSKWIVYRTAPGIVASRDIFAVPYTGDRSAVTDIVRGPETESMPRLSPDSRWLAYQSNETGRFEIYVRPFPGAGGRVQVSPDGGTEPLWGRDGTSLYYRGPLGEVVQVRVTTGSTFSIGSRSIEATGDDYLLDSSHPYWDIAPDGRFLMLRRAGEPAKAIVVHNWAAELGAARRR